MPETAVQTAETRIPVRTTMPCETPCGACRDEQGRVRCVAVARHRAVRWWLVGVGLVSVALGAVGVIVPGLPTTVFLIIASWCFVRSCPVLERVLIRNRFFGPFVRYLVPGAVMPTKARIIATTMLWCAVAVSGWLLIDRGVSPVWIALMLVSAVVGTVAIWTMARCERRCSMSASAIGSVQQAESV